MDTHGLLDAADHGVQHADASHAHQAEEEAESIPEEAEIGGLREQDGTNELPLGGGEAWGEKGGGSAPRKAPFHTYTHACTHTHTLPF